jgi:triosephosphate isomerase
VSNVGLRHYAKGPLCHDGQMKHADHPLLIANWKANLAPGAEVALATQVASIGVERHLSPGALMFAPSAVGLVAVASLFRREYASLKIGIAAQDCSAAPAGAETGELPATHLLGIADAVILGHSERRARGESGALIGAKVARCVAAGITPIICVGDADPEADDRERSATVLRQWEEILEGARALGLEASALLASGAIIAYEPIWAIGSGHPAPPEVAATVAAALRGAIASPTLRVLYGGSVDSTSAANFLRVGEGTSSEALSGLLIGGASLDAQKLLGIAAAVGVCS